MRHVLRVAVLVGLAWGALLVVGFPVILAQKAAVLEVQQQRTDDIERRVSAIETSAADLKTRLTVLETRGELNSEMLRAILGALLALIGERVHGYVRRRGSSGGGESPA